MLRPWCEYLLTNLWSNAFPISQYVLQRSRWHCGSSRSGYIREPALSSLRWEGSLLWHPLRLRGWTPWGFPLRVLWSYTLNVEMMPSSAKPWRTEESRASLFTRSCWSASTLTSSMPSFLLPTLQPAVQQHLLVSASLHACCEGPKTGSFQSHHPTKDSPALS